MLPITCPLSERDNNPKLDSPPRYTEDCEGIRLAGCVSAALRRTGYLALRDINVSAQFGVVILQGRVASFHLKQLAQEAARRVVGARTIRNKLEVTRQS